MQIELNGEQREVADGLARDIEAAGFAVTDGGL